MGIVVGIDACRNRSGGPRSHLRGILEQLDPALHGIERVHVWAYRGLLDLLPEEQWLVKHNPPALERPLPFQIWWQAVHLGREARRCGCDVLFVTDASTVGRYKPMVVFSRDLLSYEPGTMRQYGWTFARFRLWAILHLQNQAFRAANGVIFLARYTQQLIERSCGSLRRTVCIPHGVDEKFRLIERAQAWPENGSRPIECLYVSNAAVYKNQWHVIRAIGLLRNRGHNLKLVLIGGGSGRARQLLEEARREVDPRNEFVEVHEYLAHNDLPSHLSRADLFIFASGCESFGITLLEAMAAGLPIACSNRSSLPELVRDGAVLFDPEQPAEIANAVGKLISDDALRTRLAKRAREIASGYSWARCARETWKFVVETANAAHRPNQ